MKQNTTNTFADGLNYDLHPIVTPNSVLTDNLNGTFITYNGNEFCLQNDRGNNLKATLSEGFVPIGIKEHNGILYIVSHNESTGETELGTYPGIDWPTSQDEKIEIWKVLDKTKYTPITNFLNTYKFRYKNVFEASIQCYLPIDLRWSSINATSVSRYFKWASEHGNVDKALKNSLLLTFDECMELLSTSGLSRSTISFTDDVINSIFTAINNNSDNYNDIYGKPFSSITITEDTVWIVPNGLAFLGGSSVADQQTWLIQYWNQVQHIINGSSSLQDLVDKYDLTSSDFYKIFSYTGFNYSCQTEDCIYMDIAELHSLLRSIQIGIDSSVETLPYVSGGIKQQELPDVDWSQTPIEPFRTTLFDYNLTTPVDIEIQDSFDGSVNLILSNKNTEPRIINSGFSVDGDKYKINSTTDYRYYTDDYFDTQTSLIKTIPSFMRFNLKNVDSGGQLKGGNYTFYAYLGDGEGNLSDIAAESGIVSIFKGNIDKPTTISGTLADERTDKLIHFELSNVPYGYKKIYISYVREFSDTQGYLQTEAFHLTQPYDVDTDNLSCSIVFNGYEEETSISIEDLNISYLPVSKYQTSAQQQNMLFIGNVNSNFAISYDSLSKFAKSLKVKITNEFYQESGTLDGETYIPSSNYITTKDNLGYVGKSYNTGEYYDPKNIYEKVGYWPGEYYRFGVVFIRSNGTLTPAFPIYGGSLTWDTWLDSANSTNEKGVLKLPMESTNNKIISGGGVSPWHFVFDCSDLKKNIKNSDYTDLISGFFIVRQKRIPEVVIQGLQVRIDKDAHVPIMPYQFSGSIPGTDSGYFHESFIKQDDSLALEYIPEDSNGNLLRPQSPYTVYIPMQLHYYTANFWSTTGNVVLSILTFGAYAAKPQLAIEKTEMVYLQANYSADGTLIDISVKNESDVDLSSVTISKEIYHIWYQRMDDVFHWRDVGQWLYITTSTYREVITGAQWEAGKAKIYESNSEFIEKCRAKFATDPDALSGEVTASDIFKSHLIPAHHDTDASGILSQEAMLDPTVQNRLDGSSFKVDVISGVTLDDPEVNRESTYRRHSVKFTDINTTFAWEQDDYSNATYIKEDTKSKVVGNSVFSNVIGSAYDKTDFITIALNDGTWPDAGGASINPYKRKWVLRGKFTPYIGLTSGYGYFSGFHMDLPNYMKIVQLSKRTSEEENAITARANDNSPFYTVSERIDVSSDEAYLNIYRGDCYSTTQTIRINRNFIDPSYPYTEAIIKPDAWHDYYLINSDPVEWDNINLTDLNTVALGQWITFKCLASSNLGLRSEDPFDTVNSAMFNTPKSFFPLASSTVTSNKQEESKLLNAGYGISVGRKRYQKMQDVPYVNQEYSTRVMFSNKNIDSEFINGYRVFQGLSYQDYDKQYGPIVKLLPWGNNLFCVFEHGLAILPVNEKALLQTTTEQTIHIYGHGVLPEQLSIVSQDYGTRYSNSVMKTPIGIYGVDTDAKKIWRFSDKQGFETLSDMKIETYLNNNLAERYNIDIDTCDIRTHYNSFKGDVMFTWYVPNDDKEIEMCSICYNERQGLWTTRYSWIPLVSENSNGEFYSLQRGADSIIENGHYVDKVGIYSHSTIDRNESNISEARPTKWYGEQHPFEFEFVVSDPIGVMKIFENLQIVSNNVQPEELQFEFVGDSYFFNKARVYHTVFENKFSDRRRWGNEVTRNLKLYLTDPSRREGDNSIRIYNKPNIIMNQNENDYRPFRNASILNDRNNQPLFGEVIKTDNSTEEYRLRIPQECRNIETWGRRLGNMHYKEGVWTTTIEPVIYDARLNNPIITTFNTQATKWNSARIRDKWCKIRIRYSGEDLAVITAIKTMLNV